MASSNSIAFLAIFLVLQSMMAAGDIIDQICSQVECGKGNCVASGDLYPYKCECEKGWKRTTLDNEDNLQFLPCIIPNCTLDYSCTTAPPPVPPPKAFPFNQSAFDPCYWIYCGEGTCSQTSTYKTECKCNSGYTNILDVSIYPCYSECVLGSDCASLGIKVANSTANNSGSQASSILPGNFYWLIILMASLAMVRWK